MSTRKWSMAEVQDWLVARIAEDTGLDPKSIDVRLPFSDFGLSSTDAVSLSGDLEDWLGRRLSPTLVWEYPNIEMLARTLASADVAEPQIGTNAPAAHATAEPIAIIGIGCRFPGADGPEAFWEILRDGRDMIREVPADRWDIDSFYDPNPQAAGKVATRWGGFLDRVDLFDALFFKISPREAERVDPQQRLLLEVAWHALEDAGQAPEALAGSRTGVFIGIANSDYSHKQIGDPALINAYVGTGSAFSIAANRLSYFLDLHGPSIAVDSACSSSLVATYLACQSLWRGECTLALAGGVNAMLSPAPTINFTKAGAMAADGRCKAFDARADGYVRGEGAGVVVLKPLSRARADGDPIYAVIRGGAINQDGRTNGLMAPNPQAQTAVLREAYRNAQLSPRQVQYIETHGTGTLLGDSIEAQALGAVMGEDRPIETPCLIGSVKTNIGHLEAAAGIAGLIKVALALHHRAIPPSLHFHQPNPHIPFERLPIQVQRQYTPWPAGSEPARAGISSFGFGGTNAHMLLEEAAVPLSQSDQRPGAAGQAHVLTLSAHTPQARDALASAYRRLLSENPTASLADICYTASNRRGHLDHRLALVADTPAAFLPGLDASLKGEPFPGLATGQAIAGQRPRVVFVFPGQGGQWIGMGKALLRQEPVFRAALERCEKAFRPYVDWSVTAELDGGGDHSRLDQIDVVQPTLFALQVALSELWRSWGVEPDAVVGHSMGEVATAAVAGALSLDDAARIICRRSQLLLRVRGQGGMALVELSREQAQRAIAAFRDRLSVAVSNSPTFTVLSGDVDALEAVLASLEQQNVFCRRVKVDVASHSQQMDALLDDLARALETIAPRPAHIPIYSTVTGEPCDGSTFDATYWAHNLRKPVLFADAVQRLGAGGGSIFLEISPHPLLLTSIQQCLSQSGANMVGLPSLERDSDDRTILLRALGACHVRGVPINWRQVFPQGGRCVPLPAYPWQRQRYWFEAQPSDASPRRGHPLLGEAVTVASHPGMHLWEMDLGGGRLPYLADHRLQGTALFPAAAYIEMALAAGQSAFGTRHLRVEDVSFTQALVLPEESAQPVQLVATETSPGLASFQCFSRPANGGGTSAAWTIHAAGSMRDESSAQPEIASPCDLKALQSQHPERVEADEHYREMAERGLNYGPSFQSVVQVWRQSGSALGHIRLPAAVTGDASRYHIHPALLDACFQVLAHALPQELRAASTDPYVPVRLKSLGLDGHSAGAEAWCHATISSSPDPQSPTVSGDARIIAPDGHVLAEITGLQLQRLSHEQAAAASLDDWWYAIAWERQASQREPGAIHLPAGPRGGWIIFADRGGIGQQLYTRLIAQGETAALISHGREYRRGDAAHYEIDPASPADLRRVLKEVEWREKQGCYGIVYLWGLDSTPTEATTAAALEQDRWLGCGGVMALVQTIAQMDWPAPPRLWLVTAGAQAVASTERAIAVAQTPLWGFGRVVAREHPELRCRLIDLEPIPTAASALWQELWSDDGEEQVAWRAGWRHVARLAPAAASAPAPEAPEQMAQVPAPFGTQPFRLNVTTPGVLDTLALHKSERRAPGPGEVEIQVYAAGLNFRDVLIAMGLVSPGVSGLLQFGLECAGKIVRVGPGVDTVQIGDRVVAVTDATFGAFVTAPAICVAPIPGALSFEEAATVPITFMTAHYALSHLGRMRRGERVLIHAAAGGVGMAAVQLVQHGGGEIFATAGSPEKRALLRSLGIAHVMDSRSLHFADETLAQTDGMGVDIVLNSLSGEAIARSLDVLAPYGRFLEIGKRDIEQNMRLGLKPFQKNLSYFAIDLNRMGHERPQDFGALLSEIMALLAAGAIRPLPMHVFPIDRAADAFRFMAQAKHIGKVVLSFEVPEVLVRMPSQRPSALDPAKTYLITGGLGGLGLTVARWMVARGARYLALISRSRPSISAQAVIESLGQMGARVLVVPADLADADALSTALSAIDRQMPPLAGVIHAAGLLDDGLVLNLDSRRLGQVMRPKVEGAWNLHTFTRDRPLDFFVLFSSAASMLGSPGQGNYAAGNAFLDGVAHHRRMQGLPGLSINWGAWSEVGLAARPDRGGRLAQRGINSITPAQGLEVLGELLDHPAPQIGVLPFNMRQWHQSYSNLQSIPFFSHLVQAAGVEANGAPNKGKHRLRQDVLAAEPAERRSILESQLREYVARIIGLPTSQLDVHLPLSKLGIDSLMAVELKNRVELDFGIVIPVTKLLQGPSVTQVAELALAQLDAPPPTTATQSLANNLKGALSASEQLVPPLAAGLPKEQLPAIPGPVDRLSDDEVDRMLKEMLAPEGTSR